MSLISPSCRLLGQRLRHRGAAQSIPIRYYSTPPSAASSCGSSTSSSSRPAASSLPPVYVSHIPHLVPYKLGLALQESLYELRGSPEVVLLLQHTPVYTEGRRGPQPSDTAGGQDPSSSPQITEEKRLTAVGADYVVTKRGGLITYHGPGQLVGYPILHLGKMGLSNRCYVDHLQSSLASFLHSHSLPTVPPPDDNTGVWVDADNKIVSIGVQVRHRITSHGFALNVTRDVDPWFKRIVACGIAGKSVTNMQDALASRIALEEAQRPDREAASVDGKRSDLPENGGDAVTPPETERLTVDAVAPQVAQALSRGLQREFVPANESFLRYEADGDNVLQKVWLQGRQLQV